MTQSGRCSFINLFGNQAFLFTVAFCSKHQLGDVDTYRWGILSGKPILPAHPHERFSSCVSLPTTCFCRIIQLGALFLSIRCRQTDVLTSTRALFQIVADARCRLYCTMTAMIAMTAASAACLFTQQSVSFIRH